MDDPLGHLEKLGKKYSTTPLNSITDFFASKGDYATILLLDHRYERTKTLKQLPSWIEARVEICEKFGHAMSKLTKFFAAKQQNTKDI